MNIKKIRTQLMTWCTALGLVVAFTPAIAQENSFSDDEVETFVMINKQTMPIQMEAQQNMMNMLKEEGMDINKFQQMAMAAQQGDETMGGATEEEKNKFTTLATKMQTLQQELGVKMEKVVKEEGMEPVKFQQMAMKYQQDAEFRQEIDALMAQGMNAEEE